MNKINIRLEEEKDYRKVEELTREAFWESKNVEEIGVGCTEHFYRFRRQAYVLSHLL